MVSGDEIARYGDMLMWDTVAPRLGLSVDQSALNSVTRGLIGDTAFAVLPEVTPAMTFMLTLFFQIVSKHLSCSSGETDM